MDQAYHNFEITFVIFFEKSSKETIYKVEGRAFVCNVTIHVVH